MVLRTLAHLSDLHLDLSPQSDACARALVETLQAQRVDHVVVTGDLTHRGATAEGQRFRELFAPLLAEDRVTLVPGNHDRPGDDVGATWLGGERVVVVERAGLYLVCLDSTGPHNRNYFRSHGELHAEDLDALDAALAGAPAGALTAVLLHHHVLPLPEESLPERFATRMGWPHAAELPRGAELVQRVLGRADLVLHGHRHVPHARELAAANGRPLRILNAGSSTDLAAFRVFGHAAGRLVAEPRWARAPQVQAAPRGAAHNVLPAIQDLARRLSVAFF